MARILKICLIWLLIGLLNSSSADVLSKKSEAKIKKAIKLLKDLPGFLGQAMELYDFYESALGIFVQIEGREDTDSRLDAISDKLDQLSTDMKNFENRLNHKLEKMDASNTMKTLLKKFYKVTDELDYHYKYFVKYVSKDKKDNLTQSYRPDQIYDFSKNIVDTGLNGVNTILDKIHRAFLQDDGKNKNIPLLLTDPALSHEFMCALRLSPQQIIYSLFDRIMLSEIKGFAMLMFSNDILNAVANINSTANKDDAIGWFNERMKVTVPAVEQTMAALSREIRKCDPTNPVEGTHYARIGPVFQAYTMYESDARIMEGNFGVSCTNHCPGFKLVKHYCREDHNCQKHQCSGNIRNCETILGPVEYCIANDNYRRYNYINVYKTNYGRNQTCDYKPFFGNGEAFYMIFDCTYCLCTCEDTGNTIDKFVSLRPVFSNIKANKVITGVRMKLKNHIFHIQIKQGILLKGGRIDHASEGWKAVDKFTVLDAGIEKNKDYYEIAWETKTIAVDDVDTDSKTYKKKKNHHVLTGLQFQKVGSTLQLVTYTSRFNFKTGELEKKRSNRKLHSNESKRGRPMDLDKRVVATECQNNDEELAVQNGYLSISMSDMEKDAGQSVLPYIDIQPVESRTSVPLSGAGIFLRGDENGECGGYLAFKLFTLDFQPYMKLKENKIKKKIA